MKPRALIALELHVVRLVARIAERDALTAELRQQAQAELLTLWLDHHRPTRPAVAP